ncbi:MAG: inositol monophosphatase family protein [Nocardioidaceae bacterium]
MPSDYTDDLRLAHVLADDADSLTMDRFKAQDLHVVTKPDLTPVSDADNSVEEAIRRTLGRARPRDAVLGEEGGATGWGPRRWVVDPIDGTKNFVRGVPVWATLIGLMVEDEVVAGVVSAPALGRRWWASRGGGAWTGKSLFSAQPCRVSDVGRLEDASVSFSSLSGWEGRGRLDDFVTLLRRAWRHRAYGDFWSYMLVAEGAVDVALEPELALHDMAAVAAIVLEAGGRFTDLEGADGPLGTDALATNGKLHDQVLAFVGTLPEADRPEPPRSEGRVHDLSARRQRLNPRDLPPDPEG